MSDEREAPTVEGLLDIVGEFGVCRYGEGRDGRIDRNLDFIVKRMEDYAVRLAGADREAEQVMAIQVEKLLCDALGRPWSAAGISIESLIEEVKRRLAGADARAVLKELVEAREANGNTIRLHDQNWHPSATLGMLTGEDLNAAEARLAAAWSAARALVKERK